MNSQTEALFSSIRRFLETYLPLQRGASPHTIRSYRTAIRQFVEYLAEEAGGRLDGVSFSSITEESVAGYLDAVERRGCSAATRNQRLASVRSFLAFSALEDVSRVAVLAQAEKVPRKKAPVEPVPYLSEEQLATLLAQPDASTPKGLRDLTMLVLLYDMAARISEVLDLELGRLHLEAHPYAVLHGKGQKARSVPLMKRSVELLKRYMALFHPGPLAPSPLFYTVAHGARHKMSYENAAKLVAKYGRMAAAECDGFPDSIHPHLLRHTRAMHLYQDGIPLSYIKDVLGHSDINTTSIYATADLEMLRKAMEPLSGPIETASPLPDWEEQKERLLAIAGLL